MGRPTDGQTDKLIDRQTSVWMGRKTDRQTNKTYKQTNIWMQTQNGWTTRQMDELTVTERRTDDT